MPIRAILALSTIGAAVTPRRFEAASVKPNKVLRISQMVDFHGGGRFVAHNLPMTVLMA
jgi:hypothetical protein